METARKDSVGLASLEKLIETEWMKDSTKRLGLIGQAALAVKIMRRWGIRGVGRVLKSQRVFASKHLGYAIVVGTRQ